MSTLMMLVKDVLIYTFAILSLGISISDDHDKNSKKEKDTDESDK